VNRIQTARIAGTRFLFDHFGKGGFWELWPWKLDPFCVHEEAAAEVVIRNAQSGEVCPETGAVLHSEHAGFFRRDVLRAGDGGSVWRFIRKASDEVVLQYHLSADYRRVTLYVDRTESSGMVAFEYLNQMVPFIQLKHDAITFHGVLLEYEGGCIAVCADSGVGKTTHARLWRDCKNALILNGDRAVLRKNDRGWMGYGSPWSGSSGEQINRCAPLKALVILERGERNLAVRLNPIETLTGVLAHVLFPGWDPELTGKAMDLLDDLLTDVPVFRLRCRPDEEAVQVLYDAVYGE